MHSRYNKTLNSSVIAFMLLCGGLLQPAMAAEQAPAGSDRSRSASILGFKATGIAPAKNQGDVRALLVPRTESVLSSQIATQIIKLNVTDGQRFKKGDVLIKFECAENRAELAKARAELNAASKTHQSNKKLLEHRAINRLEVDVSAANVARARGQVALMNARVKYCTIVAPYDGRVSKKEVNPYDSATQGQPLLEIIEDAELKMEMYVPSQWLAWLKKDMEFSVTIDETGNAYTARITGIGSRVDPVSQTVALYALVDGKHPELLAGMSGVANFPRP